MDSEVGTSSTIRNVSLLLVSFVIVVIAIGVVVVALTSLDSTTIDVPLA